jgi:peptide/nickel transport system substrate-binding protein
MDSWKRSHISRRSALRGGGVSALGLAAAFTIGCGDDEDAEDATPTADGASVPPTPQPSEVARKGGTIRMGGLTPAIDNADIHQSSSDPGAKAMQWSIDTLMTLDEAVPAVLVQAPGLAESLEQVDDLTYVYHLRKGVKFQNVAPVNGREFTADDAVFSLKRMSTQQPTYPRRSWLAKAASIEAVDRYTVRIRTSEPVASLSYLLASPWVGMISPEQAAQDGERLKSYIGTGPYVVDRLEPGITITYSRNPEYWGNGGNFDKVELVSIPDKAAEAAAFRAGEVTEFASIPPDTVATLASQVSDAVQYKVPSPGLGIVAFNGRRAPLGDPRVRQALALACDIPGWIQVVSAGQGGISGPIAPAFTDWALPESRLKYHAQNLTEARSLLDAAGIDPAGLKLKAMTLSTVASYVAMATQFQADMKQLGAEVEIEAVSSADYSSRLFTKFDFDVTVGQDFSPDDPDRLFDRFHSTAGGNYAGYSNPALDSLLEKQRSTLNKEQRRELVLQAQDIIVKDAPTFYTYFVWSFTMANSKLTNWRASALSGNQVRWNARNAWLKA